MCSHSLLQIIFPTEDSNLRLLYFRQIHYHLSHHGSSRVGPIKTDPDSSMTMRISLLLSYVEREKKKKTFRFHILQAGKVKTGGHPPVKQETTAAMVSLSNLHHCACHCLQILAPCLDPADSALGRACLDFLLIPRMHLPFPCLADGTFPWRRKWLPTPVFLPGKSHGQRSLVGYSPWGCKESDTTEHANTKVKSF